MINNMINQNRLVKNFIKLGAIDSPSGKEGKIVTELVRQLRPLCDSVKQDKLGNVLCRVKGNGNPLLLSAHTDTIFSNNGRKPKVVKGVISCQGKALCGADNKAAVAAILEALQSCRENKIELPTLELLFTVQEEIGLVGVRNFDRRQLKAKEGLCFDRGDDISTIVTASPFIETFQIEFLGRAAHAGAHPDEGVDAIAAVAWFINQFKTGQVNKDTTMNFGTVQGGTAVNVVSDLCSVTGEIRSIDNNKKKQMIAKMKHNLVQVKKKFGVKTKYTQTFSMAGYRFTASTPLIKEIKRVHKKLGWKTKPQVSTAGADANWLNGWGITTINTGYGAKHTHSNQEEISVRQLTRLAQFIEVFIKERAERG